MKFDPTKPVQTRDGRKARIICSDRDNPYKIVALVGKYEDLIAYTDEGERDLGARSQLDLINIPEKHVRYINFYDDDITGTTMRYKSRANADANAIPDRLACVRVEYEDGQFDD